MPIYYFFNSSFFNLLRQFCEFVPTTSNFFLLKMNLGFIFFVSFLIGVNCHRLEKIHGVLDVPYIVDIDSDSNTYIIDINQYNSTSRFYKLNHEKEILLTKELPCPIVNMIINKRNDVYLFTPKVENENNERKINPLVRVPRVLKLGSMDLKELDEFSMPDVRLHSIPFLDEEDYLYYNTQDGVAMLKPDMESPIQIKNLESMSIDNDPFAMRILTVSTVDKLGNVFFGLHKIKESEFYVAILEKEEKDKEQPTAKYLDNVVDKLSHVTEMVVDDDNSIWFATMDGQLRKMKDGKVDVVLQDDLSMFHSLELAKDRIYFFGQSFTEELKCSVLYVTLDGKTHQIPELSNLDAGLCVNSKIVPDSKGNVYISFFEPTEKGHRVVFINRETNEIKGVFNENFPETLSMMVDDNDDLWILHKNLYFVEKGTENPVLVPGLLPGSDYYGMKLNKKTKEIFIIGGSGVYVLSK